MTPRTGPLGLTEKETRTIARWAIPATPEALSERLLARVIAECRVCRDVWDAEGALR